MKQLDQPFEHEQKLVDATERQQEIITALDVTKNQAAAKVDEGADHLSEKVQADIGGESQRVTPRRKLRVA